MVGMLIPVEFMTNKFGYRVVLVLFSLGHSFCLIWLLGGLTVIDDGETGHILLRESRMVEDVECMGR